MTQTNRPAELLAIRVAQLELDKAALQSQVERLSDELKSLREAHQAQEAEQA